MYAVVTRRTINPARLDETRARAASEFFPKLQQAPGFVAMSLIESEGNARTAVVLWESQAQADAFRGEAESWSRALDELGHRVETRDAGEVIEHITPRP